MSPRKSRSEVGSFSTPVNRQVRARQPGKQADASMPAEAAPAKWRNPGEGRLLALHAVLWPHSGVVTGLFLGLIRNAPSSGDPDGGREQLQGLSLH